MSTMLNESNSSFDTTPSYDFLLRNDDDREVDDVVVSDVEDEDEGYDVVDNGEPEHRDDDVGVLIVPPTTGSSDDSRNTVLSIPDSVPSVMNSTILDLPNCVHVVDGDRAVPTGVTTLMGENFIEALDMEPSDPQQDSIPDTSTTSSQTDWRRNVLTLLFFAAMSACSVCHAAYLHRESKLLKEQVRLLTDEATRSAATLAELQQQQAREVMFDNCWLEAHAKMSFGECSQEATETVKAKVNTIGSYVQNYWDRMKVSYEETVTGSFAKSFDVFGFANPPNLTVNTTVGTSFKALWKQMNTFTINENVSIAANVQDLWNHTKGTILGLNVSEPVITIGSNVQDLWNYTKEAILELNFSKPVSTLFSNVQELWYSEYNLTGPSYDNITDQMNVTGRSLYDSSSTLIDRLKIGYKDLKESIIKRIDYEKVETPAESKTTSEKHNTETSTTESSVQNVFQLQPFTKKVFVAAVWSVGAAILVNTFDMYWNQQGTVLALEN